MFHTVLKSFIEKMIFYMYSVCALKSSFSLMSKLKHFKLVLNAISDEFMRIFLTKFVDLNFIMSL